MLGFCKVTGTYVEIINLNTLRCYFCLISSSLPPLFLTNVSSITKIEKIQISQSAWLVVGEHTVVVLVPVGEYNSLILEII